LESLDKGLAVIQEGRLCAILVGWFYAPLAQIGAAAEWIAAAVGAGIAKDIFRGGFHCPIGQFLEGHVIGQLGKTHLGDLGLVISNDRHDRFGDEGHPVGRTICAIGDYGSFEEVCINIITHTFGQRAQIRYDVIASSPRNMGAMTRRIPNKIAQCAGCGKGENLGEVFGCPAWDGFED